MKKKPLLKMTVEPVHGEMLRFHVTSQRARVDPYLVDLLELNGNGKCGCPDFSVRREKALREETGEQTRCKHILACMQWVAETVIAAELAKEKSCKPFKSSFSRFFLQQADLKKLR